MIGIRILLPLLLTAGSVLAQGGTEAGPRDPGVKRALNRVFRGRVVKIKKKRVTLFYDFEDPEQLKDFEEARPPRLLDASQNKVQIVGGRLVLEGSSSVRHKMEGTGELRAHFYVRVSEQSNVGTVFTEPILGDFFVVLNLFDKRFYGNGNMLLAACGLHEDEGADKDMALVNWRDIFSSNLKNKVKIGKDAEVEVYKDGWEEFARVDDVKGKGSSKGKCKEMKVYQFGFWVHHSRASFDDLTLHFELTDEYLELNNLKAEMDEDWEDIPTSGPLAGIAGVPPNVVSWIEQYAKGKGEARQVLEAITRTGLPMKAREAAARVLRDRRDPRAVPILIDGLYSEDKVTRKLTIGVIKSIVGKTFGYSPTAKEKTRSEAIRKLNAHLLKNRAEFYE